MFERNLKKIFICYYFVIIMNHYSISTVLEFSTKKSMFYIILYTYQNGIIKLWLKTLEFYT